MERPAPSRERGFLGAVGLMMCETSVNDQPIDFELLRVLRLHNA